MQQRRRKKISGAAAAESIPEVTDSDESDPRWSGDPNEEPEDTAHVVPPPNPSAKDRHPMPWGLVIADVFNIDVHKTLQRLSSQLTLGDGATEYGTVIHALDSAARNLFDAARLARKAKLEDENFAAQLDQELEVLRSAAGAELHKEHREGKRSKAPTKQDIEDRMIASWPDATVSLRARKAEMHGALRVIEALEVAWTKRCSALERLADQFRRAGA